MTALGLALTLSASVCWAALDALRKGLTAGLTPTALAAVLALGQLPFFLGWWWWSGAPGPQAGYWRPGSLDLVLNLGSNVLFAWALLRSPLSLTIPMLSLTPVFAALGGSLVLAEQPAPSQGLGIALVVGGAVALQGGPGQLLGALRREPGVVAMGAVALAWAGVAVADKACLAHAAVPVHASVQLAGVALGLGAVLALRGRLRELAGVRQLPGLTVAALVAAACATGLQLLAFQRVLVSLVEATKRAIGLAAALLNGRAFFDEEVTPGQWAAVGVMTIGVTLLVS